MKNVNILTVLVILAGVALAAPTTSKGMQLDNWIVDRDICPKGELCDPRDDKSAWEKGKINVVRNNEADESQSSPTHKSKGDSKEKSKHKGTVTSKDSSTDKPKSSPTHKSKGDSKRKSKDKGTDTSKDSPANKSKDKSKDESKNKGTDNPSDKTASKSGPPCVADKDGYGKLANGKSCDSLVGNGDKKAGNDN